MGRTEPGSCCCTERMFATKAGDVGDWVLDGRDGDGYAEDDGVEDGEGGAAGYELGDDEEGEESQVMGVEGDDDGDDDEEEEDGDGEDDDDEDEYEEGDGEYGQESGEDASERREDNGSGGNSDVENWYAQVTSASRHHKRAQHFALRCDMRDSTLCIALRHA